MEIQLKVLGEHTAGAFLYVKRVGKGEAAIVYKKAKEKFLSSSGQRDHPMIQMRLWERENGIEN